mmetsp:Transcript_117111/g.239576  ORF Transcript_117111/g.239576 Transcript_117111/m.239576 type:complete len:303 (-) Transcript_117111:253-1161(-)
MVGNKYAGIHFFLFGIVLTRCLVTAKVSWPAISSSTGFASRKDVLHNIYSSKTARRLVALEYIHHDNIKLTDPAIPVFSHTHQMHLRIRGGGVIKKNEPRASGPIRSSSSPQHEPQKIKNGLLLLASTTVLYFLFHTRNAWIDLFNKEKLQASVVQTLENLNSYPYLLSRSIYIISMALWETLGMSTIPVETAAAMVFGWSGFYWSGIGKVLGACLAFGLGRGALSTVVDKKTIIKHLLEISAEVYRRESLACSGFDQAELLPRNRQKFWFFDAETNSMVDVCVGNGRSWPHIHSIVDLPWS